MKTPRIIPMRRHLDHATGEVLTLPHVPQYIQTWQQAEWNAAAQMRALGYHDAHVTGTGPDDGIDVCSMRALGGVKCEAAPTGQPALRDLYGARGEDRRELWFFTASGYSRRALAYAERNSILLFRYSATGELEAVNETAEDKLKDLLVRRAQRLQRWKAHREQQLGTPIPRDALLASLSAQLARVSAELGELAAQPDSTSLAPVISIRTAGPPPVSKEA